MAELMSTDKTTLPCEEVIIRSLPFFTNERWRCQSQSARASTFVGRPPIPWGLILLTIIAFFCFVIPGVIMYFFVIRRMIRFQNIVVTANPVGPNTEVVITHPKTAKKLANRFLKILPPIPESASIIQAPPQQEKEEVKVLPTPEVKKEFPQITALERRPIIMEEPKGKLICSSCKSVYESGKFCRKCGSVLVEQVPFQEKEKPVSAPYAELKVEPPQIQTPEKRLAEQPEGKLICPHCKIFYDEGKFCKKCGSTLVSQVLSPMGEEPKVVPSPEVRMEEHEIQPLEKKEIKGSSREWLNLYEEKKKLEDVVKKLETQRGKVSADVFSTTFGRYNSQLESISSRLQQIEANLEFVKEKTSEEINLLVKELKPIKKRLGEVQSLYKAGAITKADFSKEKKELAKEARSRERALKKHKQIFTFLPSKMGGTIGVSGKEWNLLRPLPLAAGGTIVLLAVVGFLVWPKYSYLIKKRPRPSEPISKEITPTPPTSTLQVQPPSAAPSTEGQEVENIKYLLENIRQANLQKNIDLFMSCYSLEFKDREGRRTATLESWKDFDYLDLSYSLINPSISGNTANARIEWLIRIASKGSGQPEESKAILDVALKKEDGIWKIKEIKPGS